MDPAARIGGMCAGGLGSSDIGNPVVIGGLAREFFLRVARSYPGSENTTSPQYVNRDVITPSIRIHNLTLLV